MWRYTPTNQSVSHLCKNIQLFEYFNYEYYIMNIIQYLTCIILYVFHVYVLIVGNEKNKI